MKKTLFLLPLLCSFAIPMSGQADHATTPEQCRADADAWRIPTWDVLTPHTEEFRALEISTVRSNLPIKLIEARQAELTQCELTDKRNEARYSRGVRAYATAELGRVVDFMQRHNLRDQFLQEDQAGQR